MTVEVHLIDYNGSGRESLTGQRVRVKFLERLRAEMRFPSIDALTVQIGKDVVEARRLAAQFDTDPGRMSVPSLP